MDDILQALAKMLNMTADEVSSLLTAFKGNAPQIYETLLREKMFYDIIRGNSDLKPSKLLRISLLD